MKREKKFYYLSILISALLLAALQLPSCGGGSGSGRKLNQAPQVEVPSSPVDGEPNVNPVEPDRPAVKKEFPPEVWEMLKWLPHPSGGSEEESGKNVSALLPVSFDATSRYDPTLDYGWTGHKYADLSVAGNAVIEPPETVDPNEPGYIVYRISDVSQVLGEMMPEATPDYKSRYGLAVFNFAAPDGGEWEPLFWGMAPDANSPVDLSADPAWDFISGSGGFVFAFFTKYPNRVVVHEITVTEGEGKPAPAYQWFRELVYPATSFRSKGFAFDSSGHPGILHHTETSGEAYYSYYDGTAWVTVDPDPTSHFESGGNLAFDSNDNPAMAYTRSGATIRFLYFDGTQWNAEELPGDAGDFPVLAFDSADVPLIALHAMSASKIRLARKAGGSWTFEDIDTINWTATLWMQLDGNGLPGVAYEDIGADQVRYRHYNGSSWEAPELVDSATDLNPSGLMSFAYDSHDRPGVTYYDAANADLKYAFRNAGGWHVETVDSDGNVGVDSSIDFDSNNLPAIAYIDSTNGYLKFAKRNGAGWDISVVDNSGLVTVYQLNLLYDSQGFPCISYARSDGNYYARYGPSLH